MADRCRGRLLVLGCLALAACATPHPVSPADTVALRTGEPLLRCRQECLAAWRRAEPQAAELDAAGRWSDLAALVESVGYQDDLSLYYLGRAAEGLRYPAAAASYYRQSTTLSGTSISCLNLSRLCAGIELPQAALQRLAAIDRALTRRRPRHLQSTGRPPLGPEAAPAEAEPEPPITGEALAPVPGEPPAPPPPPPPPIHRGLPASEYVEPPPAAH
jgi:hypothetical protein